MVLDTKETKILFEVGGQNGDLALAPALASDVRESR
jgi:hypothetical protein